MDLHFDLNEMVKKLPRKPGIYMMLDSMENIIYVGKAKNLKNRVSQYFKNQKDRSPKVTEMIQKIHTFKTMVTDTELDAFIEECRLIKEIKPWYNSQMKNDGKYIYIKIPAEQYPKILITKESADDGALYFGPFTSLSRVESAVQYINDFYPVRKCSTAGLVKRSGGCLFMQLGTCSGACTGRISSDEYWGYIEKIKQLLNGNNMGALEELSQKPDRAVETLRFEKAAQYREYSSGLRHVIGKQRLVQSSSKNRNIVAVEFIDDGHAKLFLIKGNKLLHREVAEVEKAESEEFVRHLKQIIRDGFASGKSDMGRLTQYEIDEAQIIYSYLKRNKKSVMSFWIPSTRLSRDAAGLDAMAMKIAKRIVSGNSEDGTA